MGCHTSKPVVGQPEVQGSDAFSKTYTLSTAIAEGSFGQVRQAWCLGSKNMMAVKVLDLKGGLHEGADQLVRVAEHERKIWQCIGTHEHCVELVDSFLEARYCFLVMDLCEASMMDHNAEIMRAGDDELSRLFREMLLGLSHLHGLKIIHRDVKPNNFLLGGPDGRSVKLCDFGMAITLPRKGGERKGCYGTAPYMSPEMVAESGHALSTDIWSYSATLFVLVYRNYPCAPKDRSSRAMKLAVLQGHPEPRYKRSWSKPVAPSLEHLIKALLVRKAEDRPTVQQVLLMPFLNYSLDSARWFRCTSKSTTSLGSCSSTRNESDTSTSCWELSSLHAAASSETAVVTTRIRQ
mmetsp:Transcript_66885/g.217540  ORF Transcript_66885/g.217540 Transcript_66885/m.217540 type:complete len:350 (-) Transcript_66885:152-1201(-)